MFVYLVQHGKAKTEEQDPQRPLNPEGENDVMKISRHLASHAIQPDSIRHSGKLRARQTADILAGELHPVNGTGECPGLDPLDNPAPVLRMIHQQQRDLMLVGHLPFMDRLCALLVTGHEDSHTVIFQQGSVVCLERDDGKASFGVKWFLTPDIL